MTERAGMTEGRWYDGPASLSRDVCRYREPASVLARPHVGVAARCLLTVGRRVAGSRVDDGEVAHQPNFDVVRLEIADCDRHGCLLQEAVAVDQRLIRI